jgi:hypothetical protein
MKKFFYLISSVALLASLSACSEKNNGKIDFDDLVLDGFYVYGEATGTPDKVLSINSMAAGSNEVDKTVRAGMYEKYIYLEGGKEFSLIENQAGVKTYYGADLAEVNYGLGTEENPGKNFDNNPDMMILQGKLKIGEDAPALKVAESGLYHIVLDNNQNGDLAQGAQIIIQKADFGVRGGCNGWGFTAGTAVKNEDGTIVYTWENLEFSAKGEYKFASCNGWKINLDEDGVVKAEVGLGLTDGKLSNTGGNIVIGDKGGLYKITLTYTPKAGAVADSFSYASELTQESTLPEECYLIGDAIAGWELPGNQVAMIPAHSEPGVFWAVRYISDATKSFKFSQISTGWGKDFYSLGTDEGFTTAGGNCYVAAPGLYMIEVNYKENIINVHSAEVYGCAEPFSNPNWGAVDEAKYTLNEDGTVSYVLKADGTHLRSFVKSAFDPEVANWWHREFTLGNDGKIAYRGAGGDSANTDGVVAGKTVTLDFNAGTGTIK